MSDEQRQATSQAAVAAGGLPLNAVDRLREQASRQGTPSHIFTSDLSPNELLLTRQCGFEPLGQVMGSSVYHVAYYAAPGYSWVSGELGILTEAYYKARHLAMGRIQQEAKLLGASGVVGVRLTQAGYDWGPGLLEFAAVGTAVREINAPPLGPNVQPFVSSLSGQDHYSLRQGGYRPVGFAMGNCTWMQYASYQTQFATQSVFGSWQNQELTDYTQAIYAARELAMERMEFETRSCGAEGIVGVSVETHHEPFEMQNTRGIIMHFTSLGTCVASDRTAPQTGGVKTAVPLGDG